MENPEKGKPQPRDYEKAKANWEELSTKKAKANWEELSTRKKNSLAMNEMYARIHSELCDLIKGFRKNK